MVVAYFIMHNEGKKSGILSQNGHTVELSDLYEADVTLRTFANEDDARTWLNETRRENR